jgi:hypothetical protein
MYSKISSKKAIIIKIGGPLKVFFLYITGKPGPFRKQGSCPGMLLRISGHDRVFLCFLFDFWAQVCIIFSFGGYLFKKVLNKFSHLLMKERDL